MSGSAVAAMALEAKIPPAFYWLYDPPVRFIATPGSRRPRSGLRGSQIVRGESAGTDGGRFSEAAVSQTPVPRKTTRKVARSTRMSVTNETSSA
jgi:hypothetical protein